MRGIAMSGVITRRRRRRVRVGSGERVVRVKVERAEPRRMIPRGMAAPEIKFAVV